MAHLNNDFLSFFNELEQNNSKEWFDKNRKRYETSVKNPFKAFVVQLVAELQKLYPDHELSNNFSIMRINRDIRFSADKTPYKIHTGAMISPHGKKEHSRPGFFIQANHADVRVYSGSYSPEKEQLHAIRQHISYHLDEFNSLINEKNFKSTFGEIRGEKNKRLPSEFAELENQQPLIANKGFYWFFKLPPETLLKDNLIEELIKRYTYSLPVNTFFEKALDA